MHEPRVKSKLCTIATHDHARCGRFTHNMHDGSLEDYIFLRSVMHKPLVKLEYCTIAAVDVVI